MFRKLIDIVDKIISDGGVSPEVAAFAGGALDALRAIEDESQHPLIGKMVQVKFPIGNSTDVCFGRLVRADRYVHVITATGTEHVIDSACVITAFGSDAN